MGGSGERGSLVGEVVVVTGASRGIGYEVARIFAELGASIGMIARDAAALDDARSRIGGEAAAAVADVSSAREVQGALAHLESQLGPPAIVVNNAGHGHWGAVVDTPLEAFRRAIEVNYLGAVHVTAAILPAMLGRGRGHIVNVASIAGRIGAPFEAAYSASKFALVGYTESLAAELAGSGVEVSLVDPGPVDTEFFARRGHPYEHRRPAPVAPAAVAEAVVRAVRGRRAEQYVPRWLGLAHALKTIVPPAHRAGTRKMFAGEVRSLRDRYRS